MISKFQKGKWGESLAYQWLSEKNYRIIHKNWFFGHAEIDLIAWHFDTLVFVEVRLLHHHNKILPENTVGFSKEKKLLQQQLLLLKNLIIREIYDLIL